MSCSWRYSTPERIDLTGQNELRDNINARHAPNDAHGIFLGELALLQDALEQLAAHCQLERQVVL